MILHESYPHVIVMMLWHKYFISRPLVQILQVISVHKTLELIIQYVLFILFDD